MPRGPRQPLAEDKEYQTLKRVVDIYWKWQRAKYRINLTSEHHPPAVLERIETISARKARASVRMAINDMLEATIDLPESDIRHLDEAFAGEGLPTLTDLRATFWSLVRTVRKRGRIQNMGEYHALRNALDTISSSQRATIDRLLTEYEQKQGNKTTS